MTEYEENLKATYDTCCECNIKKNNDKYINCFNCNNFVFTVKHSLCRLCKNKYHEKEKNSCWECYQTEKIICECGSTVLKKNLSNHHQTIKHCEWSKNKNKIQKKISFTFGESPTASLRQVIESSNGSEKKKLYGGGGSNIAVCVR